ncbi:hypothetical protein [Actinomadura sp. 21ATH]|uniref:hypothetical protein n=1 Tax=Actinomadura sp. 21ATH TaxID=1735444 RepID=UPI0035C20EEA
MTMISRDARRILGDAFLDSVRPSDMYAPLREIIEEGWSVEHGAVLLTAFRRSYFGQRSSFPAIGDYEAAVNGRGIPDLDIDLVGSERVR